MILPPNSEIEIEVLYQSALSFIVAELYFGCEEQNDVAIDTKPLIIAFCSRFIERGRQEETPETHPDTNYTDNHKYYHIRKQRNVARNEPYSLGFKIQTRSIGKYKAQLIFIGEEVSHTRNDLLISVEESQARKMKCVLPEHRWDACWIFQKRI